MPRQAGYRVHPSAEETRMELLRSVQMKYHDANWSEKAKILDGFVAATNYDRKYANSINPHTF